MLRQNKIDNPFFDENLVIYLHTFEPTVFLRLKREYQDFLAQAKDPYQEKFIHIQIDSILMLFDLCGESALIAAAKFIDVTNQQCSAFIGVCKNQPYIYKTYKTIFTAYTNEIIAEPALMEALYEKIEYWKNNLGIGSLERVVNERSTLENSSFKEFINLFNHALSDLILSNLSSGNLSFNKGTPETIIIYYIEGGTESVRASTLQQYHACKTKYNDMRNKSSYFLWETIVNDYHIDFITL